jgi:LmbE family N-acetylglucosaminyl deacetylase
MQYNCKKIETNQVKKLSLPLTFDINDEKKLNKQSWVFITAHDDDPLIGAGMLISIARKLNIKISIVIVTDGCMGYQDISNKGKTIKNVREKETYAAYKLLGIEKNDIYFLNYPDSNLLKYVGRRYAKLSDYLKSDRTFIKEGCIGLLNSMVYYIRKLKTTKLFIHTQNDFHPDHKIVFEQAHWANYFSASNYWPELKKPLGYVPDLYEYFVYSALSKKASIQIESEDAKNIRDKAINIYKSQGEIHGLVKELQSAGPFEWLCKLNYKKADRLKIRDSFKTDS